MDAKSYILGVLTGSLVAGAGVYIVSKKLLEERMWREVDAQVKAGIESYKKGLDEASKGVISDSDAHKLVAKVQEALQEGNVEEEVMPHQSFSSLEEEVVADENDEPVNYAGTYDQYHRPRPSELFHYDDDTPKERIDNELDIEAERVVQENIESLERFEASMAERENPEDDGDPEARSIRKQKERENAKYVKQIKAEAFFNDNRDYDKETILYYKKDRVMCYENEEVIMDKEEILGPDYLKWLDVMNTTKVNSESGYSIYLRSPFLKTDYEVIIYAGSYEHFINGPDIG